MKLRRGRKKFIYIIIFVLVAALTFLGVQFFTKTGLFKVYGVVTYDESLTDEEIAALSEIFNEEIRLDKNLTIKAENRLGLALKDNEILTAISVVVSDFYDLNDNIDATSADELFNSTDYTVIDFEDLSFDNKLLKINDKYFLEEFNAGAIFHVMIFESEKFEEEVKPLIADLSYTVLTNDSVLTFAQTGVTALSRGMNAKMNQVDSGEYFAEKIGDFLSGFDITHTSNESSFSSYAYSGNICSDARFIDTLLAIGLDVVELTGNHNVDCGDDDAIATIDTYNEHGIKYVGGGKSAEDAAKPLLLSEKGTGITMLAYNESTGGQTYDATPGANAYDEDNAASEIAAAKARGDVVIVDIQYNECTAYASTYEDPICDAADSAAGDQIGLFRSLIDMGADVVVGTSAHQPQTYELYGNGVIYYGLGNIFFDQVWWPGTTRSLVLVHYFYNNKLIQTRIFPTVYDNNMQTELMDKETAEWFLERLQSVRP